MKTAIVIGHHENSKGAYSPFLKLAEWDFYQQSLAYLTLLRLDMPDIYVHDPAIKGYTSRIKDTAARINKCAYDLVIELHFNAAASPRANGCETLYYFKSAKGKEFAQLFSNTVNKNTGIRLRNAGLKALSSDRDRGFASVFYTVAPTILIEPFFGSNAADCDRIDGPKKMARIIQEFLINLV
jgi:N-acetylmuramoyl-L-alanine amidase